jgi:hypothetical protein
VKGGNVSTDRELPPLPEPINKGSTGFGQLWTPLYTADQMRAYAALIAEDCAKLVGEMALRESTLGRSFALKDASDAIRARYKAE